MNINNLQIQLQEAVNNAAAEATTDGTSSTLYYLQLAKAVQQLNMGQIRTVANIASLPTASTHEGWLFFVQDVELLYFSNGTAWDGVVPIPVPVNGIWMWGQNCIFSTPWGNLGNNSGLNSSSPVSVVGGFTDWCQVSAGRAVTLAVRTNGSLWSWGQNNPGGVLGDNTLVNKSSPVSVIGGFTDWCQVSAGISFSLAVRQNGTAWAWGQNNYGQLGADNTTSRSSPVSVVGGFCDWCQISAGYRQSLAVRTNGTLWAWGNNGSGRLGDNTTVSKSSPVSVVGGFTDWCRVSLGYHSMALRQNGTIWAWGCNNVGQLGDNTVVNKSSPVSVIGGFTDWCQLSAGARHGLAIRTNGSAWSWGQNSWGQLGTSSYSNCSSPVSVVGGFTDWCQVSGAYQSSFGLRTNGTIFSWGRGTYGALGDNSTSEKNSPASIAGGFTDWICLSYPQSTSFSSGAIRSTL
jgi:alpha-tubulin suppressor-like RCC1 family protein